VRTSRAIRPGCTGTRRRRITAETSEATGPTPALSFRRALAPFLPTGPCHPTPTPAERHGDKAARLGVDRYQPGHPATGGGERAGEFIITRPRSWSRGSIRRFRLELDGRHITELAFGATIRVPAAQGHHELHVRCWPLGSAHLAVELAPHQILRLAIYVGALDQLVIAPDDHRASP
jgi:hypothetical protein